MSNKYAEYLKRIIGIKFENGGLNAPPIRSSISSNRGIGYVDATGTTQGASGSKSANTTFPFSFKGVELGGDADDPDSDSTDDQDRKRRPDGSNGGGGGFGGPGEIGKSIFDKNSGSFTAEDIFNNKGPSPGESNVTDGTLLAGGRLREMVASHCATGKEMRIRFDGVLTPPEATYGDETNQESSYIVSVAWTDPEVPPEVVGFVNGQYYRLGLYDGVSFSYADYPRPLFSEGVLNVQAAVPDAILLGIVDLGGGSYRIEMNSPIEGNINLGISQFPCPAPDGTVCNISTAPLESYYPDSGWYDAARRNPLLTLDAGNTFALTLTDQGKFAPSQYDSNTPANLKQGVSKLDFCFTGGRYGTAEPTRDGGYMLYETQSAGGALMANTTVRFYSRDGQATGYGDGASITAMRPSGYNN